VNPPISLMLLYGGAGRRFGSEKGLAPFRGEPLVERLLRRLSGLSDDVFISSNAPEHYAHLGLPVIADEVPGQGPLGGLLAGVRAARHELLAVVAGDMPFAAPRLLRHLADAIGEAEAAVPTHEGRAAGAKTAGETFYEPLHAVYRRSCEPALAATIAGGQRRILAAFPRLRVRKVPAPDWRAVVEWPELVFANANTVEELARLEAAEEERFRRGSSRQP
jgi:molybdopterin-guanine dinucleotide biosynthesis protein A